MATKKSTPPRSIGRQLNFTTARMNALCLHKLEPHGLSLPQWVILSCLWRDGNQTVGTLSNLIGTGLPATSRIIDRMVDRGLVARRRDETDKRITMVSATEKALELNHLANFYDTINKALFVGFSSEEREQAFDLLRRMELNAKSAIDK
ncbi:MAG: MarR family winged helix-turn-helix transcriptional regulator [Granulosicoccus sp.]